MVNLRLLLLPWMALSFMGPANAIDQSRLKTGEDPVQAIAFSPDGKTLAVAIGLSERKPIIRLVSTADMTTICDLGGHNKRVHCLEFTPDSKKLVSGGLDHQVNVWDVAKRQMDSRLDGHKGQILSLSISPDGTHLATSSEDKSVFVWNLKEGKIARELSMKRVSRAISYLRKGNILAIGGDDHVVRIWDLDIGKEIVILDRHSGSINAIVAGPDGKSIITTSADGTVKLWTISIIMKTGNDELSWDFGKNTPLGLAIIPNTGQIAIGTRNGQIALCSTREQAAIAEVRIRAHDFPVFSLAVSPDGKSLASGSLLEPDLIFWSGWPK